MCILCDPGYKKAVEKDNNRGYISGIGLNQNYKCKRCGSLVDMNFLCQHDEFHAKIDEDSERENGYGIFSVAYQESKSESS